MLWVYWIIYYKHHFFLTTSTLIDILIFGERDLNLTNGQVRHLGPPNKYDILPQCWSSVTVDGPILIQHRVNDSPLLAFFVGCLYHECVTVSVTVSSDTVCGTSTDQVRYSTKQRMNQPVAWRDQPITAVTQLLFKLGGLGSAFFIFPNKAVVEFHDLFKKCHIYFFFLLLIFNFTSFWTAVLCYFFALDMLRLILYNHKGLYSLNDQETIRKEQTY